MTDHLSIEALAEDYDYGEWQCSCESCTFGCPQDDTGADLSPSEDSEMPYFDVEGNSGTRDEVLS